MTESNVLGRGDHVPHFEVTLPTGGAFAYASIWQHKNLVLVTLPDATADSRYASELSDRHADFARLHTACVITFDRVAGLPAPGVLVADRWGEVVYAAVTSEASDLPHPSELIEWVDWIARRCS